MKNGRGMGHSDELGHSSSDMSARLSRNPPPTRHKTDEDWIVTFSVNSLDVGKLIFISP